MLFSPQMYANVPNLSASNVFSAFPIELSFELCIESRSFVILKIKLSIKNSIFNTQH
jgi:hypothetical protein